MPIPSDFLSKAALIQAGAVQYAASLGKTAEEAVADICTWLAGLSDSIRTIEVQSVQEVQTTNRGFNTAGVLTFTDVTDVFVFNVRVTYLEDGANAVLAVGVPRASIEA